jgi:flagellar biosynthetic protein FliR
VRTPLPFPSDSHILTFLALLARVLGVLLFAPLIGTRFVPTGARVGIALAVTVMLLPQVPLVRPPSEPLVSYALLALRQLAVGMALGLAASLLMACAQMGGEILDVHMGIGAAQLFDPTVGEQASVLGRAHHVVATMVFLTLNGHHWLLLSIFRSLQLVPLDGPFAPGALPFDAIFTLAWRSLEIALRIAAPGVAALFLADAALGLIARAVPQMNVFFVGIPPKIMIGLIVLGLAAPFIVAAMSGVISELPYQLDAILRPR